MEITVSGLDLLTGFFIVCGASNYGETLVILRGFLFFVKYHVLSSTYVI